MLWDTNVSPLSSDLTSCDFCYQISHRTSKGKSSGVSLCFHACWLLSIASRASTHGYTSWMALRRPVAMGCMRASAQPDTAVASARLRIWWLPPSRDISGRPHHIAGGGCARHQPQTILCPGESFLKTVYSFTFVLGVGRSNGLCSLWNI
jgi:hypothetical protein